jgi:hypothetical protein
MIIKIAIVAADSGAVEGVGRGREILHDPCTSKVERMNGIRGLTAAQVTECGLIMGFDVPGAGINRAG